VSQEARLRIALNNYCEYFLYSASFYLCIELLPPGARTIWEPFGYEVGKAAIFRPINATTHKQDKQSLGSCSNLVSRNLLKQII